MAIRPDVVGLLTYDVEVAASDGGDEEVNDVNGDGWVGDVSTVDSTSNSAVVVETAVVVDNAPSGRCGAAVGDDEVAAAAGRNIAPVVVVVGGGDDQLVPLPTHCGLALF